MKKSILTIAAIAVAIIFNIAQAQSLDDILAKHFKAIGQDKLVAAKTIVVKAKVSQMGMEMPLEMKIKKPNKFLVSIDMQGQKMVQAFDGEKGWTIAPWISAEPQDLAGPQLEQAQQQADLEGELYNYKQKGSTADFAGKVNIDGKDAYRIKLTTKDGNTKDYFIDTDTYYISKVKATVENQGQTIDVEQNMSDYKTFNGITMPTKITSKTPMGTGEIVFEDVKFNENLDDSTFKRPAN
jgi:outer membrane lipoprotein-sorting protein